MRLFILIFLFLSIFSLNAQTVDSVRSSALLMSYSSLHASSPNFGPDTIQVQYDDRGNEISKILISAIDESTLGVPIILRQQFDSLDRILRTDGYAFNIENIHSALTLADTATARMDTILVNYEYFGDTCAVESYQYRFHSFGIDEVDESKTYTFFDTLNRETYLYELHPNQTKTRERTKSYEKNMIVTNNIFRHSDGKVYSKYHDTLFMDTLGLAINKKHYDEKGKPKYNLWTKCGNCEHQYFRNDSSQINRELWTTYDGIKWKEILYEYEKDKIIKKTSRLFHGIDKGDSLRIETYEYDHNTSLVYYEFVKRKRINRSQKVLIKYAARKERD